MKNYQSIFLSAVLSILLSALLSACATPMSGSHLMQAGKPIQKIDPNTLNTGVEAYRLSVKDVLLIKIEAQEIASNTYKIEKGNQLRVAFAMSQQANYKISPNDELNLEFPDEVEGLYTVLVSPDGYVTLPRVGKSMKVTGLSLNQLSAKSISAYKNLYISPKLSWSLTRTFNEQLTRMSGEYFVGSEGNIVIAELGQFYVLGKSGEDVLKELSEKASSKFNNPISASVSVAKVNQREQVDNRLTPNGLQISYNPSNIPSRIADDGTVYISEVGEILAQGKTIAELKEDILKKVQPNYQNPIMVSISMQEYADYTVFIGGEVRQPGRYPYAQKLSMLKLIALAGWGNENADFGNVLLLRGGKDNSYLIYKTNLDEIIDGKAPGAQDLKITPQDLIIVPPTGIARANRFITQYVRGILPFGTTVVYSINSNANINR